MRIWLNLKRRFFLGRNVVASDDLHLGLFSWVSASRRLTIGRRVYIGKMCSIQCNGTIGDGVLIANNVGIVGRLDHDFRQVGTFIRDADWVGDSEALQQDRRNAIVIGPDVWIGYGAVVLTGITIGRGAIVGAGSVVRSDVAPYDIVAGSPACTVGRRFTDEQIARHEHALLSK